MMRFVLRVISALTALAVVMTTALALQFVTNDRIGALLSIGVFGLLTLTDWMLTILVGPFAAVQLWRLRPSGRRATVLLAAFGTLYYLSGLLLFRGPGTNTTVVVIMLAVHAAVLAFLLSSRVRSQCGEGASP